MRQEDNHEGALFAKQKRFPQGGEKKYSGENKDKEKNESQTNRTGGRKTYPPCPYCKKKGHSKFFCWFRPEAHCKSCNQYGHVEKVCKNKKGHQKQQGQ